jgi:hypothetical protein
MDRRSEAYVTSSLKTRKRMIRCKYARLMLFGANSGLVTCPPHSPFYPMQLSWAGLSGSDELIGPKKVSTGKYKNVGNKKYYC